MEHHPAFLTLGKLLRETNKKYYVYAFWSVCMCVMYVLSYLSSYILFIKICYFILP